MISSQQHRSTQAGFTLLELLVAIMILTLIMSAALGAVRMGSRSFEAGVMRADKNAEIRVIANILRRQFRQLLYVAWSENNQDFIAFDGGPHHVQFIAPAPDSSSGPGYLVYRLDAATSQYSNTLVLTFASHDPGSDQFEMPANSRNELLANDLQVSFDYYGSQDEIAQPDWHDEWLADSSRLPAIVRMRITSAGQQWPELLFRVRFEGGL